MSKELLGLFVVTLGTVMIAALGVGLGFLLAQVYGCV